jgi:peptidase E
MPTYILHGGETKVENESNSLFFKEIARRTPENATCLLVFFSCIPNKWEQKFKNISEKINEVRPTNTVMASFENFEVELKKAEVVYFHGGAMQRLLDALVHVDKSLLKQDKVYIGSSAGANMLCEQGHSGLPEIHCRGLGILPVNILVHSDKPLFDLDTKKILKHCSVNKPLIRIPETEFITLEF